MYSIIFTVCIFIIFAWNGHAQDSDSLSGAGPVTITPAGVIRGTWMETRRGKRFQAYRGIKYAEPPVGELRFQPPRPILRYPNIVNATADGPACPQPVENNYPVDEDCLTINVYTPTNICTKNLPVIFYMHPGGFYSVSGRSDVAGPEYLLEYDVVLVTINYRLGTLGFISTGDALAPGNNGLKDQVVALRWVKRNIAAFGGNPNLVTLTGYSAGSLSVLLHMVSPMSKGLFHRAISMSGSPTYQTPTPRQQKELAVKQATLLNCPSNTSKEIIDCLKTKTSKEIGDSLLNMFVFGFDPVLLWSPVVENDFGQERFLTMDPSDAIRQGKIETSVPYIISQTKEEFFWKAFSVLNNDALLNQMNSEWERIAPISFLLPRKTPSVAAQRFKQDKNYLNGKDLAKDAASATALGNLYSDGLIGFAVHKLALLMSRYSKQPVYFDMFSYVGNNSHYLDPVTKKPISAAHHDELIYLFTISASFPLIELNTEDSKIVDKMTAIWYTFARYGNPNPRGDLPAIRSLSWPVMTYAEQKYVQIDKDFTIHSRLFDARFKVWEELFPIDS